MRFVCESCRAQYMINDEKVGPKGVKVRCRKCGYVILVKRTDAAKAATGALPPAPDVEDGQATQVMQSPLTQGADATLGADVTNPGLEDKPLSLDEKESKPPEGKQESFFGADEDEIGAVFDQVLKTGSPALGDKNDDDRQSTRVIDAGTVQKLVEESGTTTDPKAAVTEEVPQTDWYVAINEKQTGPLTLDKVKEHWDHGEVGPDSLCWRAGFSDWIPLSDVKTLASVLAPKPPKPIVVAAMATGPSVVSVPVQSAFSSGGVVQTVQSEMQVPISASAPPSSISEREESGTWRPSAASALASLVKEELDVLAKPPAKKEPESALGPGLLDLPMDEKPAPAPALSSLPAAPAERPQPEAPRPPAPVNPYLANPGATYSAPAVTQYRQQGNRNMMLVVGIGAALIFLALIALVAVLVLRQQPPPVAAVPQPTPAPVAAVTPTPAPTPAPVAVAPAPAPAPTPTPAPTPAPTEPAVAANPAPTPPPVPAPAANPGATRSPPRNTGTPGVRVARVDPPPAPEPKPEPARPEPRAKHGGDDDDGFADAFGTRPSSKKHDDPPADTGSHKKDVYIPPAPGAGGDMKDSLSQLDVMEVVLANKPSLAKCVEEQKKREPGVTGKLVMKWQIQTSGKTSQVSVVTDEFKGTYMAGCVGGLIKGWVFPRHKNQGEPIQFPFKF
jgi:predicted Zn finger-like uncharacterized protein